jgi:hypothetical protein
MNKDLVMKAWIVAMVSAIATPALAIGSDVVRYPKPEGYQSPSIGEHYGIGIPAPRLRSFVNAPWVNANTLRRFDLRRKFHHE